MKGKYRYQNMPPAVRGRVERRFASGFVTEPNSGCWLWDGTWQDKGYGTMGIGYQTVGTHRVSWLLHFGEIPDGLQV